jgi:hypothetical protein
MQPAAVGELHNRGAVDLVGHDAGFTVYLDALVARPALRVLVRGLETLTMDERAHFRRIMGGHISSWSRLTLDQVTERVLALDPFPGRVMMHVDCTCTV